MKIVVAAPGRAGGALALAADAAGHQIVGLVSRSPLPTSLAAGFRALAFEVPLPAADLLVVAARDQAISEVAERLAPTVLDIPAAIHLSGFTPLAALASLQERGLSVGSFHPLQTLPTAELGAVALAGASVAVTASDPLRGRLWELAQTLDLRPFDLADADKPVYHAAAAAASNYVVAALGVAEDLFRSGGVSPDAARPLTERVVANAYELGARPALTGPIARGDWDTVLGQISAADAVSPDLGSAFRSLAEATGYVANVSLPESRVPGPESK
ncbi:MAG TPA: DUF2520 domain-containing protein [Acidimicrobiia bacterium]|nr:DUF2520 domain-containing protein [Acidimicrobiia bacterium]